MNQYEQEFLRALLQAQPLPPPRCERAVQLDIWACIAEQDNEEAS